MNIHTLSGCTFNDLVLYAFECLLRMSRAGCPTSHTGSRPRWLALCTNYTSHDGGSAQMWAIQKLQAHYNTVDTMAESNPKIRIVSPTQLIASRGMYSRKL